MPRYRYESPFERVFTGLSVGVGGTAVHPAGDRAVAPDGSTVVLGYGDELTTDRPVTAYGLVPIDEPADEPGDEPTPAPVTATTTPADAPAPTTQES